MFQRDKNPSKTSGWGVATGRTLDMSETPVVTGWFSEEEGGRKDCPDGKAGVLAATPAM